MTRDMRIIKDLFLMVPLELDSDNKQVSLPVNGDFVVLFECVNQMFGVLLSNKLDLDPKIINYLHKSDWAPHVAPQSRRKLALVVASLLQTRAEELIYQEAGVGKSIHANNHADMNSPIIGERLEIIFVHNLFWDECKQSYQQSLGSV